MVKIVTAQEIRDYVLSQPDNKPVNNENNFFNDECGCVMVQYGVEILGIKDFGCGFYDWNTNDGDVDIFQIEDETSILHVFGLNFNDNFTEFIDIKTFGELKKYCR